MTVRNFRPITDALRAIDLKQHQLLMQICLAKENMRQVEKLAGLVDSPLKIQGAKRAVSRGNRRKQDGGGNKRWRRIVTLEQQRTWLFLLM